MIQFIKTIAAAKRRQRRSCEDQFAVGDALAEELNVTAPPLASQGRISSANRDNLYKRLRECADQLDAADCAGYDEDSLASYLNTALKFPPETRDCTLPFSSYVAAKTPEQHKQAVSALIGHIRAHSALYGFTIAPIKKGPQCNDTIVSAVLVGRDAEAYANPVIRHGSRIGHLSHLRSEITAAQRRRETFEAMANGMKQSAAKREIELMCRNARRIEEDQLSIIDMLSGELAA